MKHCKHCGISEDQNSFIGNQCRTCKNGLSRYNMTRLDMISLHESQDGKCKLCDKEVNMFSRRKGNSGYIDHDHSTGKVRSILCHPCNTGIGYLENAGIDINRLKHYLVP